MIVHFVQNPDVCGEKIAVFGGVRAKIHFVRNGAGGQALGFWLWALGRAVIGRRGKRGKMGMRPDCSMVVVEGMKRPGKEAEKSGFEE